MSVLVYCENWDGKFKKLSFELVAYASQVAKMMDTNVCALSIGNVSSDELNKLGNYGAQRIISVQNPNLAQLDSQTYTAAIAEVAQKVDAKVIVISHNNTGKSIAPRLSVRLKAALGPGVSRLPLSVSPFTVYKRAFSGASFMDVTLNTDVKIITLAQNSFDFAETAGSATIEEMQVNVDAPKTTVCDVQRQTGKLLLTDAEIVVSGGRGM
ncbi:MAG: electron transfer flavoprotein subunit alpha/FixB family protein, partial [Bacteroidales bacterium]|nr:electron transfer flavoprotein subunit alpha/FixB family protein [Bacteroidales bacterium]